MSKYIYIGGLVIVIMLCLTVALVGGADDEEYIVYCPAVGKDGPVPTLAIPPTPTPAGGFPTSTPAGVEPTLAIPPTPTPAGEFPTPTLAVPPTPTPAG